MSTETNSVDLDAQVAAIQSGVLASVPLQTTAATPTPVNNTPVTTATAAPKRRGRPPGSKNKPKDPAVQAAAKKPAKPAAKKPASKPAKKTKREAGVKAQAQVAKSVMKFFVAIAKETKLPLSRVVQEYIYAGVGFKEGKDFEPRLLAKLKKD